MTGPLAASDSAASPGVLGFLVVALLGVATFLLIRSMRRQMRKIDFNEDAIDRERRQTELPADRDDAGPDDGSDRPT